jgi:hypothetical protein
MGSSYKKNNPNLRQPKMQHIRSVKPEFFQHEEVAELQPFARLAWIGLWTCADKHGRFEWKPKSLKVKVLPFDSVDFETLLAELMAHNFIEQYEVDGQLYGYVVNWSKHQGIGTREKDSNAAYPAPSLHSASTVSAQDGSRAVSVGVGVGIGLGIEKNGGARAHFENRKMPDFRFDALRKVYLEDFEEKSPTIKAPFEASDGKALQVLLRRQPRSTLEELTGWLKNAFASDDVPPLRHSFRLREFCAHAEKYAKGPLKRGGSKTRSAAADETQGSQLEGLTL